MLVRPLSILLPSPSALTDIDEHVTNAKSSFAQMRAQGQYTSLQNQIVVYRITDNHRSYTGIILGVDTSEFDNDTIVHHELTMPDKVDIQAAVAKEEGGLAKPILLTNRAIPAVSEIMSRYAINKPLVDIHLKKYNARHQVWPITETQDIETVVHAFSEKEKAYIVDGHHRTRAIEQLSKDASVPLSAGLCGMFDIEQLEILPFHRIVDIDMQPSAFIDQLSKIGSLQLLKAPRFPLQSNEIVILIAEQHYSFTWSSTSSDSVVQLDVNLLSTTILSDILHIDNESTSSRINYIEGNQSIDRLASKIGGTTKAAFLLHPISIDTLIDILNAGHVLPPKSTFLLPRMANGIVSMTWKA